MKKMTTEQIENKKRYINEQLLSGIGNYSTLFIRTYYYILCCCRKNQQNWCYGKEAGDNKVARYAYAAVRDGYSDHMGNEIIYKIKQELSAMGYISFKLVDDTWRIYINRDLDFLAGKIEDFITDLPDTCEKNNLH